MKKMMIKIFTISLLAGSSSVLAGNDSVSLELERVITTHNAATSKDSESVEDLMQTMHSDSPAAMHIKTAMEQMFPVFDLETSVVEFSFVGLSGNYAFARVKQKLERITGPASFKSNVSEQMFVFKKDQEKWKIWQASMLDVDYL